MKPLKMVMVIVFLLAGLANSILADEEGSCVPKAEKSGVVSGLKDCVNSGLEGIKEISGIFWKKAHKNDSYSMTTSSLAQPGSYSLTPPRNTKPNKEALRGLLHETCDSKK